MTMKFDSSMMRLHAAIGRRLVLATMAATGATRAVAAWAVLGGATGFGGFGIDASSARNAGWPGWWVDTVAAAVLVAGLLQLMRLLRRYEQERPFNADTALHLRNFALALVVSVLVQRLLPVFLSTLGASAAFGPPHLTLFTSDLWIVLIGGLLWLIAHVMVEAERLSADNEQIV